MIYENEITVETTLKFNELDKILKENNFQVKEKYEVKDIYMLEKGYEMTSDYLDALKHTILLRNIITENEVIKKITYKYKEYNEKEEIVRQGKINLGIDSIEDAKELFEQIGYCELIKIYDRLTVYANESSEICVQEVNDKHVYIEIEEKCNYIDKKYESIDEMIEDLKRYNIPLKSEDYFVKKAEIELKEKYGEV